MIKNKIILVFDNLNYAHLSKDVCELILTYNNSPYLKSYIYTSSINLNTDYLFQHNIVKYNYFFLKSIFLRVSAFRNLKSGDYLLLYHGGFINYIFVLFVKILKKNVTTILKLDIDEFTVRRIINIYRTSEKIKHSFRTTLGKNFDHYIVETYYAYNNLKNIKPFSTSLAIIPNGISANQPFDLELIKEKIILVVGRIGATQKNHQLLLYAFSKVNNLYDYKLYFVGPVDPSFQLFFDELCKENISLRSNVVFTGNLENKADLYELYKRSKLVAFSSFYEGFSIAMIEALYFGCYLISSDLAVATDLTKNGKFGTIVPINSTLIKMLENKKVNDLVKFVHKHQLELINSNWFIDSSDLFADKLQLVISPDFDTSSVIENSKNIFANYNWDKIRAVFNSTIK